MRIAANEIFSNVQRDVHGCTLATIGQPSLRTATHDQHLFQPDFSMHHLSAKLDTLQLTRAWQRGTTEACASIATHATHCLPNPSAQCAAAARKAPHAEWRLRTLALHSLL
jgi:hypothetical protein